MDNLVYYGNPFFRMFQKGSPSSVSIYNQNLVKTSCYANSLDGVIEKELVSWEYVMEKKYPVKATCNSKFFYENIDFLDEYTSLLDTAYYTETYYYEYVR